MCDVMSIIGLTLTAGSTFANMQRQNAIDKARAKAMRAERERQTSLDEEAFAHNDDSRGEYENFEGKRRGKAATLADMIAGHQGEPPPTGLVASSSNVVNQAVDKAKGRAKERQGQQNEALASLRAYGDTFAHAGREQAKDGQLIGQIAGFKQGSQAVLPLELEAANNAGNGWGIFADLAGGFGGLALNSGLSGGSPFGGSPARAKPPVPRPRPRSVVSLY